MLKVNYRFGPNDKTLRNYQSSRADVRGFMGPVGGGKTSCVMVDLLQLAIQQRPSPRDGVRYSKWVIFRDTYRNLARTTIPSWNMWVPRKAGKWSGGGGGEPGLHLLEFPLADPQGRSMGSVHMEVQFVAVGDNDIEDVARGLEVTGAVMNEMDRLPFDLFTYMLTRVGRYPADADGGPSWYGVMGDFNAPNFDNWCYDVFVENKKENVSFFRQPGGMHPDAENLQNLPGGREYYQKMLDSNIPDWKLRRMVHNQFGYSRDGKPVYLDAFHEDRHVSQVMLRPERGRKIYIGLDSGQHPAAAIMQMNSMGQLCVLDELVTHFCGPKDFASRLHALIIDREYERYEIEIRSDPASHERTEMSENEGHHWASTVSKKLNIKVKPARTQNPDMRREALRSPMKRMIDAERPAFIIDGDRCPTLKKGLNHAFKYKKLSGGGERYSDKVDKTDESHVCEACEYGAMHAIGLEQIKSSDIILPTRRPAIFGDRRANQVIETDTSNWRVGGF